MFSIHSKKIYWLALVCCLFAGSLNAKIKVEPKTSYSKRTVIGIKDFGDPNAERLKKIARDLQLKKSNQNLIITQFGDSHSATDFFSGKLRALMQEQFGNGGIGFIPPMTISGQYYSTITWQDANWHLSKSMSKKGDFPLGGFIATATQENTSLQVIPKNKSDLQGLWTIKVWAKSPKSAKLFYVTPENQKIKMNFPDQTEKWFAFNFTAPLPIKLSASKEVEIGGFWLQKKNQHGVILSGVGMNGAQLTALDKWSSIWKTQLNSIQSDLIILAFGTNEAFNTPFDGKKYKTHLIKTIQDIRSASPKATILLMSPPDSFASKNKALSCSERYAPNFDVVKKVQLEVAQSEKTLYWDWQNAMGGKCTIDKWVDQKLAQKDFVHLTRAGYDKTASIFYRDFIDFIFPVKINNQK